MPKASVLIVEDDGLIAMHLSEMLERAGYCVPDPEYSGEIALDHLKTRPRPDVILMDIGLGGKLDGIETAREIRRLYNIPVIFLTAFPQEDRITEAGEDSGCGYILKPCLEEEIVAAIGKALKK